MEAAMDKWWNDCISKDSVRMQNADGSMKDLYLVWGDRVRVLEVDNNTWRSKIFARNTECCAVARAYVRLTMIGNMALLGRAGIALLWRNHWCVMM